jgi:hypothetical protein
MVDALGMNNKHILSTFSLVLSFMVISCRSHHRGQGESILRTKSEWQLEQVPIITRPKEQG